MVETNARGLRKHEASGAIEDRASALKERVYATFTGLSVLGAILATGHATPREALLELSVAIFGISIAGFLAEVIAHEVSHERWPTKKEIRTMARIALGALGSASAPAVVLLFATLGVIGLNLALWIGVITYAVTPDADHPACLAAHGTPAGSSDWRRRRCSWGLPSSS